jgi:hypothetical protein
MSEVGPKKSYQNHLAPGESERSMLHAPTTSPDDWLTAYTVALDGKAAGTVDAYLRALRQFLTWLAQRPGHADGFTPEQFTRRASMNIAAMRRKVGYFTASEWAKP